MMLPDQQDVEKGRQRRSRIVQILNVPPRVRFRSSLTAALLNDLFEHPVECVPGISTALTNELLACPMVFPLPARPRCALREKKKFRDSDKRKQGSREQVIWDGPGRNGTRYRHAGTSVGPSPGARTGHRPAHCTRTHRGARDIHHLKALADYVPDSPCSRLRHANRPSTPRRCRSYLMKTEQIGFERTDRRGADIPIVISRHNGPVRVLSLQ